MVPAVRTDPLVRHASDDLCKAITVDEALQRILSVFAPLEMIRLPLDDALGLALAVDVIAGSNIPSFPNSAMDGFAVRAADTLGATTARSRALTISGEAIAGHPTGVTVEPGCAVRIMTGAPVPIGADAVIRFEETDEEHGRTRRVQAGDLIRVFRTVSPGENVRPAGEDVGAGETVLSAGTGIRPAEIGLLAALGRSTVTVHRRPNVAILATGDELADPGQVLGPGQIRNCNSPMLSAMVRRCGGNPIVLGVARDSTSDLRAKFKESRGADLLITIGGVSAGDYDQVKEVLRMDGRIDFWQVRIKPGKPLAFGQLDGTPLLGLPGNPVAAAIAFEQFARPAIRRMLGCRNLARPVVLARLASRVENGGGRRQFVRVRVEAAADEFVAYPAGPQGAGILTSLTRANGLLVVAEDVAVAEAGELLPVQMLDWDA